MTPTSPESSPLPPLNDGRRVSHLELARHVTGERRLDGLVDDTVLEGPWLQGLERTRAQVEPFDFEVLRARAARLEARAPRLEERPAPVARPARRWFGLLMSLAVLAGAAVIVPRVAPPEPGPVASAEGLKGASLPIRGPEHAPSTQEANPTLGAMAIGTSGGPGELSFVLQRDGKRVRGGRNTSLQDGDLIAFRCYAAQYEEVTLARISADGTVSPLDPAHGYTPLPLDRYQRVEIEGYEQVTLPIEPIVAAFFGPWNEATIRQFVQAAWATGGAEAFVDLADTADNIDAIQLR